MYVSEQQMNTQHNEPHADTPKPLNKKAFWAFVVLINVITFTLIAAGL